MNIFELILSFKSYPIQRAKKKLELIKTNVRSDLESYQEKAKWEIFNHHSRNNYVYSQFLRSIKYDNWLNIPVIKKTDIQSTLSNALSAGYNKKNTHYHNTSGSTGTPFHFTKDKFCHSLTWAIILDRYKWHNIINGSDLQARFYGIPRSGFNYYKEKMKDLVLSRYRFPVFDLSDKNLEGFLQVFKRKPFVYVNGYTSSLVMLARYCIDQGIVIKKLCPTLKLVFPTSEVCDNIDRLVLERGFGVNVVNEYGAAELDILAFENNDGDWLINNETLYVEILDDNNLPQKCGIEGKVVVTSLYNKAMPFIRYELGDRAILTGETKGPYKLLEKVVGRTNDIIHLPSGKKAPGLTFYYVSKKLLEEGGFLKEFIIKQKKIDHFHFEYVANREIGKIEKTKISNAMKLYLEDGLTLSYERKEKIERTNSGKLKHFYSELNDKL